MKKYKIIVFLMAFIIVISGCTGTPDTAPARATATQTPITAQAADSNPSPAPSPSPEPVTPQPVVHIEPEPQTVIQTPVTPPPNRDELVLTGASYHIVIFGDTLAEIAAMAYGRTNMFYFPLIRLANKERISNPDWIEMYDNLIIPDLRANLENAGARRLLKAEMLSTAAQFDREYKTGWAARLRELANEL